MTGVNTPPDPSPRISSRGGRALGHPVHWDAAWDFKKCMDAGFEEIRFVADSMLGKLVKWLRILGYDTHYQSNYRPDIMDGMVAEGRRPVSRRRDITERYSTAVLLHANDVGGQLAELREALHLFPDRSRWFSRCSLCNVPLTKPRTEEARENVPEYVFYHHMAEVRSCPSCGRYYWPGSHRTRMVATLRKWGFSGKTRSSPAKHGASRPHGVADDTL
jgi:uncharacterized protein with PIN domain